MRLLVAVISLAIRLPRKKNMGQRLKLIIAGGRHDTREQAAVIMSDL